VDLDSSCCWRALTSTICETNTEDKSLSAADLLSILALVSWTSEEVSALTEADPLVSFWVSPMSSQSRNSSKVGL